MNGAMKLGPLTLGCFFLTGANAVAMIERQWSRSESHFWPFARGYAPKQYGTTDVVPPLNLSAALEWSWHHPDGQYGTLVGGGPVIDSGKNLNLTTSDGFRKFSPDGEVLWHYEPPGPSNNMPALMGDRVCGNTKSGHAFALSQKTGEPLWVISETFGFRWP